MEWDKRNPLEKRRVGLVDYETYPVPAREFFPNTLVVKQFILDNNPDRLLNLSGLIFVIYYFATVSTFIVFVLPGLPFI